MWERCKHFCNDYASRSDWNKSWHGHYKTATHVHPVGVVGKGGSKGYRCKSDVLAILYEWCCWRVIGRCHDSRLSGEKKHWGSLCVMMLVISRCASLSQVNSMLREQLEQAGTVNHGLTESLWKAREDVELCDTRLRREQEVRKTTKMKCLSQKSNRESSSLSLSAQRLCN